MTTTSTAHLRAPLPPGTRRVPPGDRQTFTSLCERCDRVAVVRFVDGLCAECRAQQWLVFHRDHEQDLTREDTR